MSRQIHLTLTNEQQAACEKLAIGWAGKPPWQEVARQAVHLGLDCLQHPEHGVGSRSCDSSCEIGAQADIEAAVAEYLATPAGDLLYLYEQRPQTWQARIPPDATGQFFSETDMGFATCRPACQEHWRKAKSLAMQRNQLENR